MAYIKTLKNNELIGGTDNTDVYPVSTTQALFSQTSDGQVRMKGLKPEKLEDRLEDHEEDAADLHSKVEKTTPYLTGTLKEGSTTKSNPIEITGNSLTWTLSGYVNIVTPGDFGSQAVAPSKLGNKELTVSLSGASTSVSGSISGNNWVGTYNIPNVVGTYTGTFTCNYNNLNLSKSITMSVNLRKYFGFADSQPASVEDLITLVSQDKASSHFSNDNTSEYTVTIKSNGTSGQKKRIYFAIPKGMVSDSTTRLDIVQTDALKAPLANYRLGNITRTIGNSTYVYALFVSGENEQDPDKSIDSWENIRLTFNPK